MTDTTPQAYRLRLYVAGDTGTARLARNALERLGRCSGLAGCLETEVLDVVADPAKAEQARIIATPLLVREHPGPPRSIVGDLSDLSRVVRALELPCDPEEVA